MNAAAIRTEIHDIIDHLDDSFLKVVHAMFEAYRQEQQEPIVGYNTYGNPVLTSIAETEYARRVEAMKNGESISIKQLKEEAAKW
ncbi:MAG: hypothetical protein AAGI23_14375 [Bacteroidota bacterium]